MCMSESTNLIPSFTVSSLLFRDGCPQGGRTLLAYRHCFMCTLCRRRSGLAEVGFGEAIQVRSTHEDISGHIPRGRVEQVSGDVGEVGVEVGVVGGDAHTVGADEPGRGLDLRLAAFDGRPAVTAEVLLGGEGEVGGVGVTIVGVVPLDAG